jgi:D-alanine-D-alanine ligase
MKIAVLANLKKNAPGEELSKDQWDDLDSMETIGHIIDSLEKGGHKADFFEANINPPFDLIGKLDRFSPDLCFNIAEGHSGVSREAQIPAVLDMLRLPYTGSDVLTLSVCLDKPMTKRVLHYHELPTPEFQVFSSADEPLNEDLGDETGLAFPLFVKPSREGTGIGITGSSVVYTLKELREKLQLLLSKYRQPVLCERFIAGREITVGILGNLTAPTARRLNDRTAPAVLPGELIFFPPMEIDVEKYDPAEGGIYTNNVKVELVHNFYYTCPAKIKEALKERLFRLAAAVFRVTGCRDVARVDFRVERETEEPYILEINPLPGLNPEYSDLCIEAAAYGWDHQQLINSITDCAAQRLLKK